MRACASSAIFVRDPSRLARLARFANAATLAALIVASAACRGSGGANDLPDAAASPQASAEPAPLANVPTATVSGAPTAMNPEAGPPPLPMRGDRELPVDVPREPLKEKEQARDTPKDPRDPKELTGWSLQAVLRPSDVAAPQKAPEVSDRALDAARKKTESRLAIDLSQTRMRIVLASGFALPAETEIRAKVDRYGHVLLMPRESSYRVVAPGALRALLGERRMDVAPLSPAEITQGGEGPKRFNFRTRKVDLTTRAAKASFEIALVKDAGEGGSLLCRALLDLMNAPPSTVLCAPDEIPVRAELRWTTKGAVVFEVTSVARRLDLAIATMAAPPASLSFASSPPTAVTSEVMLSRAELAALRTGPIDLPPAPPTEAGAPRVESGLLLVNASDELRFAWIDGVAVAWLAPGAREELSSLQRGRYVVQWRTFLGDSFEAGQLVSIPGMSDVTLGDAGAPR
jgi:hypothetical protein